MGRPLWSDSRRWVLIVLLTVVLGWLTVQRLWQSTLVPWNVRGTGAAAGRLLDRLDPNVADPAELAALPVLGPARARAIVDYRQQWRRAHADGPAFETAEDLLRVKGIGPATLEELRPWLRFDETEP